MLQEMLEAATDALNTHDYPHGYTFLMYDGVGSSDHNGIENRIGARLYLVLDSKLTGDLENGDTMASDCTAGYVYDLLENSSPTVGYDSFGDMLSQVMNGIHVLHEGRSPSSKGMRIDYDLDAFYLAGAYWTDDPLINLDVQVHHLSTVRNAMLQGQAITPKEFWVE